MEEEGLLPLLKIFLFCPFSTSLFCCTREKRREKKQNKCVFFFIAGMLPFIKIVKTILNKKILVLKTSFSFLSSPFFCF